MATVNGPGSSSCSASSSRASAKQKVADSWAHRRKTTASAGAPATRKKNKKQDDTLLLPVCQVVRHAWQQLSLDVGRRFQLPTARASSIHNDSNNKSNDNAGARRVFPSIVSILQASAVASQVETFQEQEIAMDVLPPDYDWQKAIHWTASSRDRAFLLLDLSAVVKSHVTWKRLLLGGIQLEYRVQHNRDSKLLQLFGRLQVALRTNSSHDVEAASRVDGARIVDDAGSTRKPDGYLRRYLLRSDSDAAVVAVDGPDEVKRIRQTHQRVIQREPQRRHDQSDCKAQRGLEFVLKLPRDSVAWESLVQDTHGACSDTDTRLVGISVELISEDQEYLQKIQESLECISQSFSSAPMKVDVTGTITERMAPFLSTLAKSFPVTADASDLLVAHAGALCTRIIGVKQVGDVRHLYIDDGCYGSLSSSREGDYTPLPLWDQGQQIMQTTTVWGPTCDGLDRVCQNVVLPQMNVDEWLVFPDMGLRSGMGTAFNGFDPPDTAYCVLGYFGQASGQ